MAPEAECTQTCIRGVRLEFLWPASCFNEFTVSFANSAANLRPLTRGGFGHQGRGKMSPSQGETGRGIARDPFVCQLEGIPSPIRRCIIFQRARHRSNGGLGLALSIPPPRFSSLPSPTSCLVESNSAGEASASPEVCNTSQLCAFRIATDPRPR